MNYRMLGTLGSANSLPQMEGRGHSAAGRRTGNGRAPPGPEISKGTLKGRKMRDDDSQGRSTCQGNVGGLFASSDSLSTPTCRNDRTSTFRTMEKLVHLKETAQAAWGLRHVE